MAATPTRPSIADQLERIVPAFDQLVYDARLIPHHGRHDKRLADLEERGQAIAASIVASFRGEQSPSAPPIAIETQGNRSKAWY